jgi:hypothetical protein
LRGHSRNIKNIYGRFASSLFDKEIAILGVNTARSLTIKHGRINETQIAWIREKLCPVSEDIIKIIVTHHPFDLPDSVTRARLLDAARLAMQMLAECGAMCSGRSSAF